MDSKIKFFLGANSGSDFVTYFKQLQRQNCSMQLLIFKGGPGSGKSSLMKRVMKFAEAKGHTIEAIACASDPSSLDAVIDHTASFAMMDGTAPHTEDPSLPGARHHIVYTGDLWDTAKLSANNREIEKLSIDVSDCHKGAGAYIKGAAALLSENMRYAESYILRKKALAFANSIIGRLKGAEESKTEKRLLSAVSVGEIKLFSETPYILAEKVFVIDDDMGAASDFILKAISCGAKLKGESFIYCPCSVMPKKCDHLIFPDSRIAVVTQNSFLRFNSKEEEERFYSPLPFAEECITRQKHAKELLDKACALVKKAKDIHDDLEAFYIDAMDFSGTDKVFEDIIRRFYS